LEVARVLCYDQLKGKYTMDNLRYMACEG